MVVYCCIVILYVVEGLGLGVGGVIVVSFEIFVGVEIDEVVVVLGGM